MRNTTFNPYYTYRRSRADGQSHNLSTGHRISSRDRTISSVGNGLGFRRNSTLTSTLKPSCNKIYRANSCSRVNIFEKRQIGLIPNNKTLDESQEACDVLGPEKLMLETNNDFLEEKGTEEVKVRALISDKVDESSSFKGIGISTNFTPFMKVEPPRPKNTLMISNKQSPDKNSISSVASRLGNRTWKRKSNSSSLDVVCEASKVLPSSSLRSISSSHESSSKLSGNDHHMGSNYFNHTQAKRKDLESIWNSKGNEKDTQSQIKQQEIKNMNKTWKRPRVSCDNSICSREGLGQSPEKIIKNKWRREDLKEAVDTKRDHHNFHCNIVTGKRFHLRKGPIAKRIRLNGQSNLSGFGPQEQNGRNPIRPVSKNSDKDITEISTPTKALESEKKNIMTGELTEFAYRETLGPVSKFGRGRETVSRGLVRVKPDLSKTPICGSFLRGIICTNQFCRKRHDLPPEAGMPLCLHFQKNGQCLKMDSCPFRHVKVNPRAMECPTFNILGYCEDPDCVMKHVRKKK